MDLDLWSHRTAGKATWMFYRGHGICVVCTPSHRPTQSQGNLDPEYQDEADGFKRAPTGGAGYPAACKAIPRARSELKAAPP